MRIAMVLPGFCAGHDDPGIPVLRNLVLALGRVHDLSVYAVFHPTARDAFPVGPVRVHPFGREHSGLIAQFAQMRAAMIALRDEHGREPFDLVHGLWADLGGFPAVWVASRLGLPVLVTVIGGELDHVPGARYGKAKRPNGLLARHAARRADAVAVLSQTHRDKLARELPWLAPIFLPFGVDTSKFRPDGPRADLGIGRHLLIAGSLVPVKGHAVAIEAFAGLAARYPDLVLHVAGDGPCRAALEEQARAAGLTERVHFHGHVAHDALPALYRAAEFCVLASWFETAGMVIFEAAACGRLTTGSDVGSMGELLPAELCCPPGDAAALTNVIERALTLTDGQRRAIGDGLRDIVLRSYTVPQMAERYLGEYRRLAAGNGR
jgi:glycosyltransferase involved in cell wall biosynthesis